MSGFDTVGMSTVSAEELEQIDGGFAFALGVLAGIGSVVVGMEIGKSLDGGGGEPVPGLNQFLLGTRAIATAAGGRP